MARPRRIVVIGDLNGADDVLVSILRGTRLMDARGRWAGGRAELVQMGDVFNRGSGARHALDLMLRLRREARAVGGRVTVLLGNHEVMTALRNEAYCTEEEYLSFATDRELDEWTLRVRRATRRIFADHGPRGPIPPLGPRLESWKVLHVPGRAAMRRTLGPRGKLGRVLRAMPIAYAASGAVFVHAGLLPVWARLGIDGLNEAGRRAWAEAPAFYRRLPKGSMFRNMTGPLWNRSLVEGHDPAPLLRPGTAGAGRARPGCRRDERSSRASPSPRSCAARGRRRTGCGAQRGR